jgi:phage gp29-like protein
VPDPTDTTVARPANRYRGYARAYEFVTPYDLRRARHEAEQGNPGRLFEVLRFFDDLDYEIPSAMRSLTSAVLQDDIQIVAEEESDPAQRQRAFVETLLKRLSTKKLVKDLMKGHYYGFRAHELVWGDLQHEGETYKAPVTYEKLPMSWIYARTENRTDDYTTLYVGNRPYHQYPRGSVLLYTSHKLPSYESIDFTRFGHGLAASRFGIFDWFDWEDWAAYNEAFATPSVVGTLMEGWNGDDKELLEEAVMNFTSDSRAVITENGELDLKSPSGDASGTYAALQSAAARARSAIIKSESLTDQMGERGSYAAMRTTNGIRVDVAEGIAAEIAELLNRHVITPAVRQSWDECLVHVSFMVTVIEDLLRQLQIDRGLHRMGVPLSISELRERYDRQKPDDDEDTLPPRSAGRSRNPFDDIDGP